MITYEAKSKTDIKVFVDGKHVGNILGDDKGFRYKVARQRVFGKYFASVLEVKKSLE